MNILKFQYPILLPGLVIAGSFFLNVANAQLLLLIWLLYYLWNGQCNTSISMQFLGMLLLAVWITLSQFWSDVGAIGWFTTWTILALPLAYIGWNLHSRVHQSSWLGFQNFLGVLGSILAVWGIYQVVIMGYLRAVGPLSDPNAFGCLLNLLWFPLCTRFIVANNKGTIGLYGLFLLLIHMALMMSGSRTASLIWLVLFVAIAIWQWRAVSKSRIVFVCVMAAGNYFIYSLHSGHLAASSFEAAIVLPQAAHAANSPRILMWQSTINMWLNSPWFGGGLGSWNYQYPAFRLPQETGTSGYYAHNDYLQLLQEGGITLFAVFFGLCGWLYLGCIKKNLAARSDFERIESIGLLAGITAVFLHATVNFSIYLIYINILVGIYLGKLTQVNCTILQQELIHIQPLLRRFINFLVLMLIVVNGSIALLSSASLSLLRGEGWQAIHALAPRYSQISLATLLASIRPSDTNAQRYITASLENEVINSKSITPQQARAVFDEIIDGYELMRYQNIYDAKIPTNEAGFLIDYIKRYGSNSNFIRRARELLLESLNKDPSMVDSAILLGETYSMEGNVGAANKILEGMISKTWRQRDGMIIEAEILKLKMPQHANQLSELQQELRGMKVNCGEWECGKRYEKIEISARQILDEFSKK